MIIKKVFLLLALIAIVNLSCKKFLEIPSPKDKIAINQVFESNDIATSTVTGLYSKLILSGFGSGDQSSVSVLSGLSADELKSHNSSLDEFYRGEIPTTNTQILSMWTLTYNSIYTTNAILKGLEAPNGVTENLRKQLIGETKFIRAFCYFYLLNLYGDVPLNLTTDYRVNEIAKKSSKDQVYVQIISDLIEAENLLSDTYISIERIRPNKWVAKALLSRVYLFTEQWQLAQQKASEVINQKTLYSLISDLDKVFLKNSSEAIWQLMPPAGSNTREGNLFILNATPVNVSLTTDLVMAFDPNDSRKTKWTGEYNNLTGKYYYPYKYKVKSSDIITEYSMVIRLAEMYLIRAEAFAHEGQHALALDDINVIRKRAGLLNPLTDLSPTECLTEIVKQRRLELFTEWGHRWMDLKRIGRAGIILSLLKGATWQQTDELYPIPQNEVSRNTNISQNSGY